MPNIILLNGQSVKSYEKFSGYTNCRFFSINRKSKIEKNILKGNIDIWYIASPPEFIDMLDDIYEFLSRDDKNHLITTSYCLIEVINKIKKRPLPNPGRIIIVDDFINKMHGVKKNHWNSIAVLLYFLASKDPQTPCYIFGMDGVEKVGDADYYNHSDLDKKRLARSRLYEDMTYFDNHFNDFLVCEKLALDFFNMNPNSYYFSVDFSNQIEDKTPGDIKYKRYSNNILMYVVVIRQALYQLKSIPKFFRRKMKAKVKDFFGLTH